MLLDVCLCLSLFVLCCLLCVDVRVLFAVVKLLVAACCLLFVVSDVFVFRFVCQYVIMRWLLCIVRCLVLFTWLVAVAVAFISLFFFWGGVRCCVFVACCVMCIVSWF